jgi:hypothetical protein
MAHYEIPGNLKDVFSLTNHECTSGTTIEKNEIKRCQQRRLGP